MTRKIVQISAIHCPADRDYQVANLVYALCDDGSVWQHESNLNVWSALPPIPLDKNETGNDGANTTVKVEQI